MMRDLDAFGHLTPEALRRDVVDWIHALRVADADYVRAVAALVEVAETGWEAHEYLEGLRLRSYRPQDPPDVCLAPRVPTVDLSTPAHRRALADEIRNYLERTAP